MKKNFDVRTTTTIISSFKQVVAIFMAALRQKLGWHSRLWREGSSKPPKKKLNVLSNGFVNLMIRHQKCSTYVYVIICGISNTWEEITKKPHFFREAFFFFLKFIKTAKKKNRRVLDLCTQQTHDRDWPFFIMRYMNFLWFKILLEKMLHNSNTNYHPWLPRCGGFYRHFFVDPRIYKSHILVWPLTGNWGIWVFRFSWTKTIISSDRKPQKCSGLKIRGKKCVI